MELVTGDPLPTLIQDAWSERWNQRIDAAMNGLADAQTVAGWNELVPEKLALQTRERRASFIEALLLKSSLLRAQGQRRQASSLLRRVLSASDGLGEPRGFRLLFELGLDHWIDHDLAGALDFFLLASRKARTAEESLFTNSNILWCLEALDLERTEAEERVASGLREIADQRRVQHVAEQWRAYELRRAFYRILELPTANARPESGQAGFFVKWASSLPYTGAATTVEVANDSRYLWQSSYRVRTLAGIWVSNDRDSVRVGDAIDRLYLWTWRWMAKQSDISQEKISYTLESVLKDLDLEMQSRENLLLLRNSLEWIALLEPQMARAGSAVQKTRVRLRQIAGARYPVLEAEFFLIQILSSPSAAATDSADLKRLISRVPVFKRIMSETEDPTMRDPLLPLVQERLGPLLAVNAGQAVVVDLLRGEIRIPARGQVLQSGRMAKLICALERSARVPFAMIVNEDADLRAVPNVVARLRKLTSSRAALIRGQEVIRGPDWPSVLLLHTEAAASAANDDALLSMQAPAKRASLVASDAYLHAARSLLPGVFSRRDLEKRLRISKATASRMIETFLKMKCISTRGRAKATVYSWTSSQESETFV